MSLKKFSLKLIIILYLFINCFPTKKAYAAKQKAIPQRVAMSQLTLASTPQKKDISSVYKQTQVCTSHHPVASTNSGINNQFAESVLQSVTKPNYASKLKNSDNSNDNLLTNAFELTNGNKNNQNRKVQSASKKGFGLAKNNVSYNKLKRISDNSSKTSKSLAIHGQTPLRNSDRVNQMVKQPNIGFKPQVESQQLQREKNALNEFLDCKEDLSTKSKNRNTKLKRKRYISKTRLVEQTYQKRQPVGTTARIHSICLAKNMQQLVQVLHDIKNHKLITKPESFEQKNVSSNDLSKSTQTLIGELDFYYKDRLKTINKNSQPAQAKGDLYTRKMNYSSYLNIRIEKFTNVLYNYSIQEKSEEFEKFSKNFETLTKILNCFYTKPRKSRAKSS